MATSDSDDFESADEEIEFRDVTPKKSAPQWVANTTIDSDSDDNVCIRPTVKHMSWSSEISDKKCKNQTYDTTKKNPPIMIPKWPDDTMEPKQSAKSLESEIQESQQVADADKSSKTTKSISSDVDSSIVTSDRTKSDVSQMSEDVKTSSDARERRRRQQKQQKSREPSKLSGLGAKKLGAKLVSDSVSQSSADEGGSKLEKADKSPDWDLDDDKATEILRDSFNQSYEKSWTKIGNKLHEFDNVPEELKSNKKFKEIFRSGGWQDIGNENEILSELDIKKESPVLDKESVSDEKAESGWGSWGSWGVSSLLNTASAGVSTLTSHVTHGLSILEESVLAPTPIPEESIQNEVANDTNAVGAAENEPVESFGFSNIFSGVSSITKLVESTGTKVISGGLSTLEIIGKKTMEVLQEGDPGLKKKRAFFINELNKPILSQMLREAKDKAETEEKTYEEKQHFRKVHFESLFDDFQGLVHLEALEMLSKQSNLKIQQRLVTLNGDQVISLQDTLDEVKELCDLGDEDEEDDSNDDNLDKKLGVYLEELGVDTSFDKLYKLWDEAKKYINDVSPESTVTDREMFEKAISTLAQFTSYCVEQFHKSGELLLVKDSRSTVKEADALVQITKILSVQIGAIASLFSKHLNDRSKLSGKFDDSVDVTTIFLEATNASSYVQDAFRLLIPILQVGVI